jgi:V/A-type H+-transporting ATPase subunit I
LEEPLKFLSLTLGLGIFQVATGVMIRIIKDLKERDFFRFTFLSLPTLFIQMSLLIILLAVLGILPNSFIMASFIVFLIACLLVVIFQFLKNKGFLLKLFWSFFGLYNIITGNFLADTLSFSRLFALGLTTGLLAMAINEIVFIIPQILGALKIPLFISIVLGAGIFLVGHLLNFLINCLSAYVHTSRLQYLEFFSKFFEGPGRTFKPFKRQYRYIRVT